MRAEHFDYEDAEWATHSIVYWAICLPGILTISIIFSWSWMFFIFAQLALWAFSSMGKSRTTKTKIEFWFNGPKRQFKTYTDSEGRVYVETKVGFFWIPIQDIEDLEPSISFDSQTGEKIEHRRQRLVTATFDSVGQAMETVHLCRGHSSATPSGDFEA